MSGDAGNVQSAVAAAFRDDWGRVVAAVIAATGDWDLAEECAQDAFARAVAVWARDGIPDRPGGWLTTVARNRAVDVLRRRAVERRKLIDVADVERVNEAAEAGPVQEEPDDSGVPDDRLRLVYTCCHPALAMDARVALTLRTLAGLSTAEIARAFLVPEPTMAKRLVRAKQKIRNAGIPYRVPPAATLPERTGGVLAVLYLLFNEGYAASAGAQVVRADLCAKAIRLARQLVLLMPDDAEVLGLLALMLFQDARRAARVDPGGEIVELDRQDRTLWDRPLIDEAEGHLASAVRRDRPGTYQLQAAIAACHCCAATPGDTDWNRIANLYSHLAAMQPSPIVELNRAVAVAHVHGPQIALAIVDAIEADSRLDDYHLLPAVRADLLLRLGRVEEAVDEYAHALTSATTEPERRLLQRRLATIASA